MQHNGAGNGAGVVGLQDPDQQPPDLGRAQLEMVKGPGGSSEKGIPATDRGGVGEACPGGAPQCHARGQGGPDCQDAMVAL